MFIRLMLHQVANSDILIPMLKRPAKAPVMPLEINPNASGRFRIPENSVKTFWMKKNVQKEAERHQETSQTTVNTTGSWLCQTFKPVKHFKADAKTVCF